MTEREAGILHCAAEAYRWAEQCRVQANKSRRDHHQQNEHNRRAQLYENFAVWCEREAGYYIGASKALIGL